jgi:hypothetical protein
MDAVQEFTKNQSIIVPEKFVLAGASKVNFDFFN